MGEASDHCETTLSHERTWRTTVACLGPVGRFPKAPGTAGSLVVIPMAAYLLYALPLWALALTCLLLMLFAVRCCGKAEQEMGLRDPGCMVLDEWVAIPCCYLDAFQLHFFARISLRPPSGGSGTYGPFWLSPICIDMCRVSLVGIDFYCFMWRSIRFMVLY